MPETPCDHTAARISSLCKLIGSTPLISLRYRYRGGTEQRVLVKCEQYNMTGSIKDRTALHSLQRGIAGGTLKSGNQIVVCGAANFGIAVAAIGKVLGHRVKVIAGDTMSLECRAIIKSYGAEICMVPNKDEGVTAATRVAEELAAAGEVFLSRQAGNGCPAEPQEKTMGREIGHSLLLEGITPAAFIAGVGTGGTVTCAGNYLRALFPEMKVHPLFPAGVPALFNHESGLRHRIPGICEDFIPGFTNLAALDEVIRVHDGDAVLMSRQLAKLGLQVGISSGANLLGAIKLREEMGGDRPVVTVFPDSSKKYENTLLRVAEPAREGYLSPETELIGYRALSKL